ncbi:hypothetical protein NSMS1_18500 [Nostoc sp. MS1]|nr:hypothetical protein NSMS1_18500 [Nostoc sp. MS1]
MKDRASVIRLNTHGWYVEKIADHFNWTAQTVPEVLHRWEKRGVEGLWEKAGRGEKQKWVEADIVFLEMLELSAAAGEIDLKYLDESGFCAWSEPSYSYYFRGQQKRLEQSHIGDEG